MSVNDGIFQTVEKIMVAGISADLNASVSGFRVELRPSPVGIITARCSWGQFDVVPGHTYNFEERIVLHNVQDSQSETIRITMIRGTIIPLSTGAGPVPINITNTIDVFGNPVNASMLRDNGDSTWTNFPLQTIDNQSLIVQPGLNKRVGFVFGVPTMNWNIPDVQTFRLRVLSADATPLTITDQYGDPVTLYPADGSACIPTGVIPGGGGTLGYYICTAAITSLNFAGSGAWSFHGATGPQVYIPRLG